MGEFSEIPAKRQETIQNILKSRVMFCVWPQTKICPNLEGFVWHKAIRLALCKLAVETCSGHIQDDEIKAELFESIHLAIAKVQMNEECPIYAEMIQRRNKIGLMDLDLQIVMRGKIEKNTSNQLNLISSVMQKKPARFELENGEYVGQVNRDRSRHGFGKMIYKNGDEFMGEWKNGLRHGFGEYEYSNGMVYEGEWVDNKKHGMCAIRYPDNSYLYKGSYVKGEKSGKGVLALKCGSSYAGEWLNDKKNGMGICWSAAVEELYEGEWVLDKKHGKGAYFYKNYEKYDGCWCDDLKHGRGTYWFDNGDKLEGEWVKGKKQGAGVIYDFNGEVFDVEYDQDKEVKRVNRRTGQRAKIVKKKDESEMTFGDYLEQRAKKLSRTGHMVYDARIHTLDQLPELFAKHYQ